MFHELSAYRAYRAFAFELSYWRLASGIEVDFVVDDLRAAIEAKATRSVHADHMKGLGALSADHPRVGKRIVVSLDERPRRTDDGVEILPATTFAERLWADDLLTS